MEVAANIILKFIHLYTPHIYNIEAKKLLQTNIIKVEKRFSAEHSRDRSGYPFLPVFGAKKIGTDSP